jgi:hypothetical protein
LSRIK